jgi:membrane-associated phospholipid phosphatase
VFQTIFDTLWGPEPVVAVQRWFGDGWEWLFHALTTLGASPGMAMIVAVAFWLRGRRVAWRLGAILLLTVTTNAVLWFSIGLPRPDDPRIVQRATVSVASFPSGHTGSATAVWGLLAVIGYVPAVLSVVVVAAVMLSRLYLGVHYLGDLIGGAVVGLVALTVYHRWRYIFLHWLLRAARTLLRWLGSWAFPTALALGPVSALIALLVLGNEEKGWQIGGALLGAGLGLALEGRYVRYRPRVTLRGGAWRKLVIGLSGVALFGLGQLWIGGDSPATALLFVFAPLWMILFAPAIFAWLDRRAHAEHRTSTHVASKR